MIDTGADYTIVQRRLAVPLLQAAGVELNADSALGRIALNGVGPTPLTCLVQPAGLSLVDEDGDEHVFFSPILVPQPTHPESGRKAARVPSLLGRDVLRRFDLKLSYNPPSVSLTLKE